MNTDIESFLDDYLSELLAGNAAVFAGAGLSVPAGYVDWRELIRPLSAEIGLNIDLESDLVAVAQFHVNASGQNRHGLHKAVIDAISADNPPTANHRLLARLPIRTWWTTNYDKLLETALRDAGKIVDVKSAVPQLATSRPGRVANVYKMHGDVDRPDEAVATRDDFEKYHRDRGAFVTALAGDLVSKTFLFLGFSFSDPNLEYVLSRVRLTFTQNQRRHYAVFRKRAKQDGETDEEFKHHETRQMLVIEDLKRYNIKVLLVDDYEEITEFLKVLFARYSRRTIVVCGSATDFSPWGETAVVSFCQSLGRMLVASGNRVATGLGVGIGDAIFTGALREIMRTNERIEDTLVLRPFPQAEGDQHEQAKMWASFREELIGHAGIALFVFGNKVGEDGELVLADGVLKEFEIARTKDVAVIPIGATGAAAAKLAAEVLADPASMVGELDEEALGLLKTLSEHRENLNELLEPIGKLVAKLQGRKK